MFAWLHSAWPFIAHYSVAAGILAACVGVYVLVPINLAKQIAVGIAAATVWGIIQYSAGIRDELALWKSAERATIDFAGKARDDAELSVPDLTEEDRAADRAIVPHAKPCRVRSPYDRDCRH